jgi:hypothetical protein
VLLLTDKVPAAGSGGSIEWRQIAPINSREDYSRFMLRQLADHIDTSHALCVQWDGFVLNGAAWDPQFLEYDYIGAVWPHFSDENRVGNGGFSLRSRRLLHACTSLPFDGSEQEDITIARTCRLALQEAGMRFAPERVARKFSFERCHSTAAEFGFHGVFNLVNYLTADEAVALFRSLEPDVLSRNEHLELLRWALARGRLRLAASLTRRLYRRRPACTDRKE